MMASFSNFLKVFGTASQRDPEYSLSGTFGSAAARRKQQERIMAKEKAKALSEQQAREKDKAKTLSEQQTRAKDVFERLRTRGRNAPSPAPSPAQPPFKQEKAAKPDLGKPEKKIKPSLRSRNVSREAADVLGGGDADFEDNAVMRMLRKRAAERDVGRTPYKKGGMVGSASKRADGCASKGKTKGRYI